MGRGTEERNKGRGRGKGGRVGRGEKREKKGGGRSVSGEGWFILWTSMDAKHGSKMPCDIFMQIPHLDDCVRDVFATLLCDV